MDSHTLDLLEFSRVREQVAEQAHSALGKELAVRLAPMGNLDEIREEIGLTTEMIELIDARMELPLSGLRDVRLSLKRSSLGVLLDVDHLQQIRDVAELTGRAYEYWLRLTTDQPHWERVLSDVVDHRPLARQIAEAIDPRGQVVSDATPELRALRDQLADFEARIQKEMSRLLRQPEIRSALRYSQPTMSGDHHVLAVAVNHRHKVAGVVHRTSASGETVYVEPAKVSEISAEMSLVKSAEQREIRRVLRRLTEMVRAQSDSLLSAIKILAHLDLTAAKARYAKSFAMTPPRVVSDGPLRLIDARHPLLETIFRQQAPAEGDGAPRGVVPVTVHLGDTFDLLVITGPNTGGKTVVLKTVGLLAAMALSGLPIPAAAGSVVPLFDDILADIGDEQSLQQSLSTFSAHVTRIARILHAATPRSLVLLDELGAGTDPMEGAALGQAILDELRERRPMAIVTTHLGDLKGYALEHPRVENAAVEFDPQTLQPTYRLMIGQVGESCALRVAKRLDLPRLLLARAYRHLRQRHGKRGAQVLQMAHLRHEAEQARREAFDASQRAAQAEVEFRKRKELLHQEADVQKEIERFRTTLQPGDTVRVLRFDRNGTVRRIDRRREQAAVMVGSVEWELPLSDLFPTPKSI